MTTEMERLRAYKRAAGHWLVQKNLRKLDELHGEGRKHLVALQAEHEGKLAQPIREEVTKDLLARWVHVLGQLEDRMDDLATAVLADPREG